MARKSTDDDTPDRTQDRDSADRVTSSTSSGDTTGARSQTSTEDDPTGETHMRRETHGELPSERPTSSF